MKNTLYPSRVRAWFTVSVLMLAYVLSFVDRQILNLLVGPIRQDMDISDTQMSLLMGLSFAIFYTFCGIPLGRIADSKSRRNLLLCGILVWSGMTAACGMAKGYWQFLFCRIGVAAGEASLAPCAYSMISDSFTPERRGTAFSVYSTAIYLGSGVALLLGGVAVHFATSQGDMTLPLIGIVRPWQMVFLILGAIGVVFSLCLLLLREPVRQGVGAGLQLPFSEFVDYLRKNRRTMLCHNLGFACLTFTAYGSSAWIPTFFVRSFDMSVPQVGVIYGSMLAICGSLGLLVGGRLCDWLVKRGHRDAPLRIAILAAVLTLPSNLGYLVDDKNLALVLMAFHVFTVSMPFGVGPLAVQEVVPSPMRGQASALYQFAVTLIGLGIGPTAVALGTDYVFGSDSALGYSLAVVTGISLVLALVILMAGLRSYRESLERLKSWAPKDPSVVVPGRQVPAADA
ncbi:spinster family MFS transporter [Pseudomonas synxantha]|uniref:spinster family MFS transporter n=1 Tax=Pseudomonas synxantha TaxID=47883 RepID=UPI00345CAFE8